MAFFAFFDADFACLPFGAWAFFPFGLRLCCFAFGRGLCLLSFRRWLCLLAFGCRLGLLGFLLFFLVALLCLRFWFVSLFSGFRLWFWLFFSLVLFWLFFGLFLACPLFPPFLRAFVLVPLRVLCACRHLTNCVFSVHPSWYRI